MEIGVVNTWCKMATAIRRIIALHESKFFLCVCMYVCVNILCSP